MAANRATNGPGRPTMARADPKNTAPDTRVPTPVSKAAPAALFPRLANRRASHGVNGVSGVVLC